MRTPFTAPVQSYAGDEPDTPYKRARQEWDRRMGAAVISARLSVPRPQAATQQQNRSTLTSAPA